MGGEGRDLTTESTEITEEHREKRDGASERA
jgi:hypothetical protein